MEINPKKKVLIVTYHWPPSGGVSVLRNLKFVKYLRDFGWEPIIYTAKNPNYPFLDEGNLNQIPDNIEVIKGKIWEPLGLFKKLSGRKKSDALQNITATTSSKKSFIDDFSIWIRGNFFIPDARAFWIKPSVKLLSDYLTKNHIDAILTDGPPHTNTVIGMRLSQKFNIPWIADFQDPWTQVDYYKLMRIGKRADSKHRKLEQEVFHTAKKITIASPSWKNDLEAIGAKDVDVIYYGYDESDFKDFHLEKTNYLKIFHAGILGNDRNLNPFFSVISQIINEHPEWKDLIKLEFAGEVDYSNKMGIVKNNLEAITTFHGMINRKDVIQHYQTSNLLLLPINQAENAKGRIPGKLFEYLRTQIPIIVFGPDNGDVKQIVETKHHGISVEYEGNEEAIKSFLIEQINNKINMRSETIDKNVSEFSNYEQTRKLAIYLDQITFNNDK